MSSGLRSSAIQGPVGWPRAATNSASACVCSSVSCSLGSGGIRSCAPAANAAAISTVASKTLVAARRLCMVSSTLGRARVRRALQLALREIRRERVEVGIADLGLAQRGHHRDTVAHEKLDEIRREIAAILKRGRHAALILHL